MSNVVSVSEAKTHLSKLLQRVRQGEVIYIGTYARPEAVLAPAPVRAKVPVGVWADRRDPHFDYSADDLVGPDEEIAAAFHASIDR